MVNCYHCQRYKVIDGEMWCIDPDGKTDVQLEDTDMLTGLCSNYKELENR